MKISIVGCGWLGQLLAPVLQKQGYQLVVSATSADSLKQLDSKGLTAVRCSLPEELPSELFDVEAILLLFNPFWKKAPQELYKITDCLGKYLSSNHKILYSSSTGVYLPGDAVTEDSPTRNEPYYRSLVEFEDFVLTHSRSTVLRLAGLIGPGRDPGKWLSGKEVNNPGGPVNLIHSTDIIRFITEHLLAGEFTGQTYNLCAPEHPQRIEFYRSFAERCNLPLPVAGQRTQDDKLILPDKLVKEYNFTFSYPDPLNFPT